MPSDPSDLARSPSPGDSRGKPRQERPGEPSVPGRPGEEAPARRPRWKRWALLLGVGGAGLLLWQQRSGPAVVDGPVPTTERLFPVGDATKTGPTPRDFSWILVESGGARTELERDGDAWRLLAPVEGRADPNAVEALLRELANASFRTVVDPAPSPEALVRYGLTPPRFTVSAEAQLPGQEPEIVVLEGGAENPFDGSVYLRRRGDPRVFSASGEVRWALQQGTFELRDKGVVGFVEQELRALDVRHGERHWRLERDAKTGLWSQVIAPSFGVETRLVEKLLQTLAAEKARSFGEDTPAARAAQGLDGAGGLEAVFTPRQGTEVHLRFAEPAEDAGGLAPVWLSRKEGSHAALVQIRPRMLRELQRDPAWMRDLRLLRFSPALVAKIVIARGEDQEPLVLEREPSRDGRLSEDWQVTAPITGPAQRYRVASLLWKLENLRATRLVEAPASWGRLGIGARGRDLRLLDVEGRELARLWLGDPVDGSDGESLWARGSLPQAAQVEFEELVELRTSPESLLPPVTPPP